MLSALHSVVIEVTDLAAGLRDFGRLLERPPSVDGFPLSNMRLALRPTREGPEGIAGLRFALAPGAAAGRRAGIFVNPSVPIELVDESASGPTTIGAGNESAGDPADGTRPVESGIVGLDHVVIATAAPERLRALLGDELGIRLALDRSFPARGLRLLFFRLGGVTIEVAASLGATPPGAPSLGPIGSGPSASSGTATGVADAARGHPTGPDAFHGLAWRVVGLAALHARLGRAGFLLSPIRPGHKPGTQVCTVHEPVHGVPTLLIEHPERPGW